MPFVHSRLARVGGALTAAALGVVGVASVWLLDRTQGTLVQLSIGRNRRPANDDAYGPVISADGHTVAFLSTATNLGPDDTDSASDAYVVTVP